MDNKWLPYDELVDLIRNYHHSGFTGLITGVSNDQHSFQIGFSDGQVTLLTYRIFKGDRALEKLSQIKHAKIVQHPNTEVSDLQAQIHDTSTILSRLTIKPGKQTPIAAVDVVPEITPVRQEATTTSIPAQNVSSGNYAPPSDKQVKAIKNAAVHYFGPIGAMVCDEYFSASNLKSIELNVLLHRIAAEVGANDSDTDAFLNSVS